MMAEVRVEGLKEFVNYLRELPRRLRRLIPELTRELFDIIYSAAPERTGFLRRSMSYSVTDRGAEISAEAPYAGFVEFGTRPHMIFPRRATALRFEKDGRVIFAKYVRHPGTKPHPYFRKGIEKFDELLQTAVEEIL